MKFDITKHKFSDDRVWRALPDDGGDLQIDFCPAEASFTYLSKDDAVAIAKHFGLIGSDKEKTTKEWLMNRVEVKEFSSRVL